MSQELTYFLYFLGYLITALIIRDEVYGYLNKVKEMFISNSEKIRNLSFNLFNSGKSIFNDAQIQKDVNSSKARGLFFLLLFLSFLLISQNIVTLSSFLDEIGTLKKSIIPSNTSAIGAIHWSHFMAFGIVLTEFICGWAFYTALKDQREKPDETIHATLRTIITVSFIFLLFTETVLWFQLSAVIGESDAFVNPFQGTLFEGFTNGFIALLGFVLTIIEFYMGFKMSDFSDKFEGLKIIDGLARLIHYSQSVVFYLVSFIVLIYSGFLYFLFIFISIFENILTVFFIPAKFFLKKIKLY